MSLTLTVSNLRINLSRANRRRFWRQLSLFPPLTTMSDASVGAMMTRARPFLEPNLQHIKVLDILPGANIRQIRETGVDKLYHKIRIIGLLPVRDCLLTTVKHDRRRTQRSL